MFRANRTKSRTYYDIGHNAALYLTVLVTRIDIRHYENVHTILLGVCIRLVFTDRLQVCTFAWRRKLLSALESAVYFLKYVYTSVPRIIPRQQSLGKKSAGGIIAVLAHSDIIAYWCTFCTNMYMNANILWIKYGTQFYPSVFAHLIYSFDNSTQYNILMNVQVSKI